MNTENDAYFDQLLETTFFSEWRGDNPLRHDFHSNLEFIVTPDCNLKCKYCYINRFGDELYKEENKDHDKIVKNAGLLIDWVVDNEFTHIKRWELFSGSLFSQKVGWDVLNVIREKLKVMDDEYKPKLIMIPTNYTFLLNDELTEEVESYLSEVEELGVRVILSGSIEGKYMEQNRPFDSNLEIGESLGEHLFVNEEKEPRDDEYYDKVFKFAKKHNFGFHPMVYSHDIHKWKKNFLWFQRNMSKYNIPHHKLFLLEVRNQEWNNEQIREFKDFIVFMFKWTFLNMAMEDKDRFMKMFMRRRVMNVIYSSLGTSKLKGISCSIQTEFYVRLGDLNIVPCHRTSYPGLELGKFEVKDNKITGISSKNVEIATKLYSMNHENFPMCSTCPIKKTCNYTCLGSNLETVGDMFTPNPKVCQLEFAKIAGVIKGLLEIGMFYRIINKLPDEERNEFIVMKDYVLEEGY